MDELGQGLHLGLGHQRLIRLHIEHITGPHRPIGLGDAIRPALVRGIGHNRPKSCPLKAFSQQLMINREPQWIVRRLRRDALRDPQHKRLALNRMQQLSRKPRGLQATRHNDGEGRHAGVFEVASRGATGFCVNL